MEKKYRYFFWNTTCFFIIYFFGCAQTTTSQQPAQQNMLFRGRVTTRYQEEIVYVPVQHFSAKTTQPGNKTETTREVHEQEELKFPDGEQINLVLGQVFEIKPCKTTEIDLNRILVSGGDLGSFADIICRDRGQVEKKAHFTCPGKELEFRTDSNPYKLICVK